MAPKQTDPQYKLRLTADLKHAIEQAAAKNSRSMNSEILARLEASFQDQANISGKDSYDLVKERRNLEIDRESIKVMMDDIREYRDQLKDLRDELGLQSLAMHSNRKD